MSLRSQLLLILGIWTGFSGAALAQDAAKPPTKSQHFSHKSYSTGGETIDYWLMTPHRIDDGKAYPIVLALHGRGGGTAAADRLGATTARRDFPCFVMAPAIRPPDVWMMPKSMQRFRNAEVRLPLAIQALESLLDQLPIDRNRIYVTGQSLGGAGTFAALVTRPDLFAAGVPVCGGWDPKDAAKMKSVPVWVFHGKLDQVVPVQQSRGMVEAIRKVGGDPKYTEYETLKHNAWDRTYSSKDMWRWLFDQERRHQRHSTDVTDH